MNPFLRLDAFLLARVFQPVVNLSQRQPMWWVQQSSVLAFLLLVMSGVLRGWAWPLAVTLLVFVPLALLVSLSPLLMAMFGAWSMYRMLLTWVWLLVTALWAVAWLIVASRGLAGADDGLLLPDRLSSAAQLAMAFFAACRPPAPPKRRTSARAAWGGA
jgi:lysylphosphatidylglycerol synthetase-like protein (DUF2156 family)